MLGGDRGSSPRTPPMPGAKRGVRGVGGTLRFSPSPGCAPWLGTGMEMRCSTVPQFPLGRKGGSGGGAEGDPTGAESPCGAGAEPTVSPRDRVCRVSASLPRGSPPLLAPHSVPQRDGGHRLSPPPPLPPLFPRQEVKKNPSERGCGVFPPAPPQGLLPQTPNFLGLIGRSDPHRGGFGPTDPHPWRGGVVPTTTPVDEAVGMGGRREAGAGGWPGGSLGGPPSLPPPTPPHPTPRRQPANKELAAPHGAASPGTWGN